MLSSPVIRLFASAALIVPLQVSAATYYVDAEIADTNAGSAVADCATYDASEESCGGGSESAIVSVADVQAVLDAMGSSDSNTFLFRRGNEWHITNRINVVDGTVTFDDFGAHADKPVIDGDWYGGTPEDYTWRDKNAIRIYTDYFTIRDMEIREVWGKGLSFTVDRDVYATIERNYIHDIGNGFIIFPPGVYGNSLIQNNVLKNGEQWHVKDGGYSSLYSIWAAGIGSASNLGGNTIRYNHMENIYGEGIYATGSIVEYNTVVDWHTVAIYVDMWDKTDAQTVVRGNLALHTTDSTYASTDGVTVRDERDTGSNFGAMTEVMNNVIVNAFNGLRTGCKDANSTCDEDDALGDIVFYRNSIIDVRKNGFAFGNEHVGSVKVKGNLFWNHLDATGHCANWIATGISRYTIEVNHFSDAPSSTCAVAGNIVGGNNLVSVATPMGDGNGWQTIPSWEAFDRSWLSVPWTSSVIDAFANIDGYTTGCAGGCKDFDENATYGDFDSGAIEYQPPYVMGNDSVDIGANVRVYGDGKFRNTTAPTGTSAQLSVIPDSGDTTESIDIVVSGWTAGAKSWSETSSSVSGSVARTVCGLRSGLMQDVNSDATESEIRANQGGCVAWTANESLSGSAAFSVSDAPLNGRREIFGRGVGWFR